MGVEAQRIRIAYQFDPLFAVNSSVVDVLPHQVEAVYRYLLPLPRIRFLLADDTGRRQDNHDRPAHQGAALPRRDQQGADHHARRADQAVAGRRNARTSSAWSSTWSTGPRSRPSQASSPHDEGLFVTSIDFISRHEGCLNAAENTQWDMIVVDEAHKLSAYEYGAKVERSDRYQAVEALAPRTDHLLFLTATPHRGRKDTFRRLLMLLDEDLFQKDEHVTERVPRGGGTALRPRRGVRGRGRHQQGPQPFLPAPAEGRDGRLGWPAALQAAPHQDRRATI